MARSRTTTGLVAVEVAEQLAVVVVDLGTALDNLDDAQPGYPTSTTGADPSTGGGAPDGLPVLERAALTGDRARRDLDRINLLVAGLRRPSSELSAIIEQWSTRAA